MTQAVTPQAFVQQFDLGVKQCHLVLYKALVDSEVDRHLDEDAILAYSYAFSDNPKYLEIGELARTGSATKGTEVLPWRIVGIEHYPGDENSILKSVIVAWCRKVDRD